MLPAPCRLVLPAVALAASLSAQTVFQTDFETALPAGLQPGTAQRTGVQGYAGLGPAGNQFGGQFLRSETGNVVTLTLANLPPHDVLNLGLLFAAIDSLDGAGTYPSGDYFRISLDGVTVFRESFANALANQIQTYAPPTGVTLARRVDLGFSGPGGYYVDSAYDFGADPFFAAIPHTGATATLQFVMEGPGGQSLADESWAMDNLRVSVASSTQGWTAAYGTSCGPVLGSPSVPRIGQGVALEVGNLAPGTAAAFVAFGLFSGQISGNPLPYPLAAHGMPGCWLVMDAGLTTTWPTALGATATAAVAIPANPALVGLHLFAQAWTVTPAANATGMLFSNGLRIRVGS